MDIGYNFSMLLEQLKTLFYYSFLNRLLVLACSAQIGSMITKAVINSIKAKKITLKSMASYGGMPSSHTVFATSIVFGIALDKNYGFGHPLFAFGVIISSIIMMDAVRLRGTVDKLNDIIKGMSLKSNLSDSNIVFPKHISHTTKEVISGIIFSFLFTFVFYLFFYSVFGK
jgi:acid phosphatase family membrane protein YuiD